MTIHERLHRNFQTRSGAFLTSLLLAVAFFLFILALIPDHQVEKAFVAAWVVLP